MRVHIDYSKYLVTVSLNSRKVKDQNKFRGISKGVDKIWGIDPANLNVGALGPLLWSSAELFIRFAEFIGLIYQQVV
jgi:hypothetical protein